MFFLSKLQKLYLDWKGQSSLKEKLKSLYSKVQEYLLELRFKLKHLSQTNFELGVYHLQNGNLKDALMRFKLLKMFKNANPLLDYYICHCYVDLFNFDEASKYLEIYKKSGDQTFIQEAHYYELLLNNQEIKEIPATLIKDRFDQLADKYDALYRKLKEKSPQNLLCNELLLLTSSETKIGYNKPFSNNVLDLGCGTGIIGDSLRRSGIANFIIGVDISEKMTSIARAKKTLDKPSYSQVINKDIKDFLESSSIEYNAAYDVVVMSDLLSQFPNLEFIMNKLNGMTHHNSIIALTFKVSTIKPIEYIRSIGEFYYSGEHIQDIMSRNQWTIAIIKEISFLGKIAGNLMIYMKN